jgi:hypothetical protein
MIEMDGFDDVKGHQDTIPYCTRKQAFYRKGKKSPSGIPDGVLLVLSELGMCMDAVSFSSGGHGRCRGTVGKGNER